MKKNLFMYLMCFSSALFAQFTENDVKYLAGTGDQTAYIVVDFKDGTDDRSYAWGVRFEADENLNIFQILTRLQTEEPNFNFQHGSDYIETMTFNAHTKTSGDDYWTTWKGDSLESMAAMNNGFDNAVQNGEWYGFSYGFFNPTAQAPITPIPAYHSQWFSQSSITTWLGTGTQKSLVIIDFGTETDGIADSYVFGIKHNGFFRGAQALELIAEHVELSSTISGLQVENITYDGHIGQATSDNPWKVYKGTDLSNWVTTTDISQMYLSDNEWFGLSLGARRPFTPKNQEQLSVRDAISSKNQIEIYPNPATNYVRINTKDNVKNVQFFDVNGRLVLRSNQAEINLNSLTKGVYMIVVETTQDTFRQKLIKK